MGRVTTGSKPFLNDFTRLWIRKHRPKPRPKAFSLADAEKILREVYVKQIQEDLKRSTMLFSWLGRR